MTDQSACWRAPRAGGVIFQPVNGAACLRARGKRINPGTTKEISVSTISQLDFARVLAGTNLAGCLHPVSKGCGAPASTVSVYAHEETHAS